MIISRRTHLRYLCAYLAGASLPGFAAETDFNAYSDDDKEKFLKLAKISSVKEIGQA